MWEDEKKCAYLQTGDLEELPNSQATKPLTETWS